MSRTYNNKTLEEYYTLWASKKNKMSQTEFCRLHNIPRSTFNDYARKRNRPKQADLEAVIKIVRKEEENIERELAANLDARLEEFENFLSMPNDCVRSKTKMAKCSRRFFWKTAIEYIAVNHENDDDVLSKLFYLNKEDDRRKDVIMFLDFLHDAYFLGIDKLNQEFAWNTKWIVEGFLDKNREIFTEDAFNFIKSMLSIVSNSAYGIENRSFPDSFMKCEQILTKAAEYLLKKCTLLTEEVFREIAKDKSVTYHQVLSVVSDAELNGKVFGKVFPYDFVE